MNRARSDERGILPSRKETSEWIPPMKPGGENSSAPLKCLIVDDISTNQRILQPLVGRCGMDTTTCGSGEESLELCQNERFHLVLMDLHMPTMSGFEAGEQIISHRADNPFPLLFAQTADETPNALERTTELGFDGHLSKPIRPHEIERIVTQIQRLSYAP